MLSYSRLFVFADLSTATHFTKGCICRIWWQEVEGRIESVPPLWMAAGLVMENGRYQLIELRYQLTDIANIENLASVKPG